MRRDITTTSKLLAELPIVVDKMHIAGHVDAWCLDNCDSRKIEALKEVFLNIIIQMLYINQNIFDRLIPRSASKHFLGYPAMQK